MKHISTLGLRIFILGIAFSTLFACKKVPALGEQELQKGDQGPLTAKVVEENVSLAVTTPSIEQALVTFLSGDVLRIREGRESVLEIGDYVQRDDAVVVYEASFCELQFGDTAIVRI